MLRVPGKINKCKYSKFFSLWLCLIRNMVDKNILAIFILSYQKSHYSTKELSLPGAGHEQSALHESGHRESSPQLYQHAQSGTSSGSLQVKVSALKTSPFGHPNLFGSFPKKQVKKNWQS